jgi:hypothetical protein
VGPQQFGVVEVQPASTQSARKPHSTTVKHLIVYQKIRKQGSKSMYAIIELAGKQYKVEKDMTVNVNKLGKPEGV